MKLVGTSVVAVFLTPHAWAGEADANAISRRVQDAHVPFGLVVDPIFAAPDSERIVAYTRGGDSAIWTAHYLAAEAFRYAVTGEVEALENARRALGGIEALVNATGGAVLARCAIPNDSPWLASIVREEAAHGVYRGDRVTWLGGTSRDQYAGVFFGLAVAYDMIPTEEVRGRVRRVVGGLLQGLIDHNWSIVMPDGKFSSSFWGRPEEQLTLLQIGRHVDGARWRRVYEDATWMSPFAILPVEVEAITPRRSYFKFNLASINLYNLVRLEKEEKLRARYRSAYGVVWRVTRSHGNAFFAVIHAALEGAGDSGEVKRELQAWLRRPRRDFPVDLRSVVPACGGGARACEPVPVEWRVTTDFLWQRSPFQLRGGGTGLVEGSGIDYLLPYWMGRYYGLDVD